MCELEEVAELKCEQPITDLSMVHPGEAGEVQGAVLGITETGGCEAGSIEGCDVYFVANGALTSGRAAAATAPSKKRRLAPSCNLYMRRFNGTTWEQPVLVATLADTDLPDWESAPGRGDRSPTRGTSPRASLPTATTLLSCR